MVTIAVLQLLAGIPVLCLGAAMTSRRRRSHVAWTRAARSLCRAAILLAPVALLAGMVTAPRYPWLAVPAGCLLATGLWALLDAGRRERRGALVTARVEARLGARLTLAGAFPMAALLIGHAAWWSAGLLPLAVVPATLGGLAGKPRPAGGLAGVAYLAVLSLWTAC